MLSKTTFAEWGRAICLVSAALLVAGLPTAVGAQNGPVEGTSSLLTTSDPGKQVVVTPYGKLTYVELLVHPKKDEILSSLKPSVRDRFDDWEIEAANKRNQELDANLEVLKKRNQELDAKLRAKAEEYVSFAEQGKLIPNPKFIQEAILDNPLFDDALKDRARKFVK